LETKYTLKYPVACGGDHLLFFLNGLLMKTTATIGVLSRETGCNIETIRYYEKVGMLPKPCRTEGGHRIYAPAHFTRLGFILRARALGFSLDDIRNLLLLSEGKTMSCAKVKALALAHLQDIRSRIADLKAMEAVLDELADKCSGKITPDCPIIESLSGNKLKSRLGNR
jgi:MerR family mercuric resistance operon transcriptional regulator